MKLSEIAVTSTTGNKVILYFETEQGSKYLFTDKGETKRIKSHHANTGGEDAGLKEWYPKSMFVEEKYFNEAHAFELLTKKGKIYLQRQKDHAAFFIIENGQWRLATWADAYPKSNGGTKALSFAFTQKPTKGFNVIEYADNQGVLKSWHIGSPVSAIKQISELSMDDLKAFGAKEKT